MEAQSNSNTAEGVGNDGGAVGMDGSAAALSSAAIGNGSIEFDTSSGIPEAEQRDILAGIESITVKNRLSLSEEQKDLLVKGKIRAKRGGLRFPLIVNITALVLLAAAIFILYTFHNKDEAEIREGRTIYNSAERALIREIRRETARELEEKEKEIYLIASKLTGVDAELQELYSNNQELTAEQRAIEQNLHRLQEEYRGSLGLLQNERSQILEASRVREAGLRTQLEERTSELTAVSEQNRAARAELERLSSDQEKTAAIEAQLSARYATAAAQIFMDKLSDGRDSLAKIREFLNTPSFQSVPTFQLRKELYLASVDALERMINKTNETENALAEGNAAIGEYEKQVADLQSQRTRREEEAAKLSRDLTAAESRTAALQDQVSSQQRTLNERDSAIANLQSEKTTLTQQVTARDSTIANLQSERTALTQTVTARENTINELRSENTAQAASIESLNAQLANIRQTLQSLTQ
jgi:chromosome segregation ATPase